MAECPWCHAQVQDVPSDGPCPRCGKYARDLRTTDSPLGMSSAQIPAARPAAQVPTLEVPDLVVPKPAPSRPTPSAKPIPLPSGGAGDLDIDLGAVTSEPAPPKAPVTTTEHDPFEDDLGAGPALELDTGGGSFPPRFSPSVPIPVAGDGPAPVAPVSQRSLGAPPAPSSGALPAPAAQTKPAVDPFEAQALSDYGSPPTEIWRAPQYAYRVLKRRGELVRLLAQKRVLGETTARRAEDGFVSFGERARESLERSGGRGLEQVLAAEQVLRGRDGALAGAMDGHKAELAEVDARLGAAEGELVRAKQEESRLMALYEAADEDRKRADAKLKRLDIEIRNSGADPNARATERSSLAADLAAKDAKLADAQIKLTVGQQATKSAQAKVGTLRTERQSVEQRFARQVGTRSAGVEEARGQVRAALVALGRAMMTDAATPELDTARAEVARLDDEARAAAKQVALHEAALGAYDVGKVALGLGLVVATFVLLVVLVLFPFIYRALIA